MYKIKYVFLILIFSFHAVSAEYILAGKKNIRKRQEVDDEI